MGSEMCIRDRQKEMLKLMSDDYGLDVVAIFDEQVRLILQKYFTLRREEVPSRPLETLEDYAGEQTRLFPGRRIREDFMPAEMDEGDILLCRGLEWFRLLPGEWKVTFSTLGLGMRMALGEFRDMTIQSCLILTFVISFRTCERRHAPCPHLPIPVNIRTQDGRSTRESRQHYG